MNIHHCFSCNLCKKIKIQLFYGCKICGREYIYGLYKNKFLIEILILTKYIYKNSDIILINSRLQKRIKDIYN